MTTETTDPLEQAVMEAAGVYRAFVPVIDEFKRDHRMIDAMVEIPKQMAEARERLRLHLQLALAKARELEHDVACCVDGGNGTCSRYQMLEAEIAALEARLQEQE